MIDSAENGQLVNHKLLGKCMIVKMSDKDYAWEVRMPNGNILMCHPYELEVLPLSTRAEKLRTYAQAAQRLAEIALKEAEALDAHEKS